MRKGRKVDRRNDGSVREVTRRKEETSLLSECQLKTSGVKDAVYFRPDKG